jgi:hypothetical protein
MSSNNINKIVTYLKRAFYTFQTLQSVLIPRRALEEFEECLKGAIRATQAPEAQDQ